ncbi:hypothetical protein [Gorillibacterium sp. sgz500922]|uniref:hypothetical protein n=1 Tax=Gorillibacterium sp. sgz500922 TaxID=3446694 RepID=UPI003F680426
MNKSHEVEYCNLDVRFDRRLIRNFIKDLIQEGYSLYWNESDREFTISIRSGRKLVKLQFQRIGERFKIVGNYILRDERLAGLMEKLINDTRGHAVVKRFKDRQIVIENIMFGEVIRMVEINGVERKVLYEKESAITGEEVSSAIKSRRIEERIPVLQLEIDYELATLAEALADGDAKRIETGKRRLEELRQEMVTVEL